MLAAGCKPPAPAAAPAPTPSPTNTARYPLTLKDDLGTTVTLGGEPQRLVSLAPSLTEIAFALGLGDRLVGVTTWCTYPPEARQKPKVGGYVNASEEKIVSLSPDLILCTRGTPTQFIAGMRSAGLKVFALDEVSFEDVARAIETIGALCNVRTRAGQVAGNLRDTLAGIQQKTSPLTDDQRPRALFVVQLDPLFVAGPGSFVDTILTACGARNVSGLQKPYANLSPEAAVAADPQVLVMSSEHSGQPMTAATTLDRLRQHPVWKGVAAVRDGRVVIIEAGHIAVPGPRLVLGMKEMAQAIHPELFGGRSSP
jgi:iron complex transport system substrate-binding protein